MYQTPILHNSTVLNRVDRRLLAGRRGVYPKRYCKRYCGIQMHVYRGKVLAVRDTKCLAGVWRFLSCYAQEIYGYANDSSLIA